MKNFLFRLFPLWLVFMGIPFGFIVTTISDRYRLNFEEKRTRSAEKLEDILWSIVPSVSPKTYLETRLMSLNRVAQVAPDFKGALEVGIRSLEVRFPKMFKFSGIAGNGELLRGKMFKDSFPDQRKTLFKVLREVNGKRMMVAQIEKIWQTIQPLIGPHASPEMLHPDNFMFESMIAPENRWFAYRIGGAGGFFARVTMPDNLEEMILTDCCRRFQKRHPRSGIQFGVLPRVGGEVSDKVLSESLGNLENLGKRVTFSGEWCVVLVPVSERVCLFARKRFKSGQALSHLVAFSVIFALISLCPFLMVSGPEKLRHPGGRGRNALLASPRHLDILSFENGPPPHPCGMGSIKLAISIRWKLLAMFTVAAGLPFLFFLIMSEEFIRQTCDTLFRGIQVEAEKALWAIDLKYPQMLVMSGKNLAMGISAIEMNSNADHEKIFKSISREFSLVEGGEITVYNRKGNLVWENRGIPFRNLTGHKLVGQLSQKLLAHLNKEPPSNVIDATSVILELLPFPRNPVIEILDNFNQLAEYSWLQDPVFAFATTFKSPDKIFSYMLFLVWRKFRLEAISLEKIIGQELRIEGSRRIFACNPLRYQIIPDPGPAYAPIMRFGKRLYMRGEPFSREIRIEGRQWIVTGIKPVKIGNFLLIALTPAEELNMARQQMNKNVWWFVFICFGLASFCGVSLSRKILTPVSQLSEGVVAVKKRHFGDRIPSIDQTDELGDLTVAFNKLMEGMGELEVARIVQENLLPKEALRVSSCVAYGKTVSASNLGGDYFDIKLRSDGNLLLFIGDVSGHGIPAALIMAMAKILLEDLSMQNSPLENILKAIHQAILGNFNREWSMACFVALLDPVSLRLSYINAGHQRPILFRKNSEPNTKAQSSKVKVERGKDNFLESRGTLLGVRDQIVIDQRMTDLEKGDRILFYTDGLIESSVQEERISSEKLMEVAAGFLDEDPVAGCDSLLKWRSTGRAGSPEDDVTVLILSCRSE